MPLNGSAACCDASPERDCRVYGVVGRKAGRKGGREACDEGRWRRSEDHLEEDVQENACFWCGWPKWCRCPGW